MLLRASQSEWLARQFQRRVFARRASRRFLPGEDLDSALGAAGELRDRGIATLVTLLGEHVNTRSEAEAVTREYSTALTAIKDHGLDCQLSVKPSQMGMDVEGALCLRQLGVLLEEASITNDLVWVDMEGSDYVERTLDLIDRAHEAHSNVGVCLQAYLHRAKEDLERLIERRIPVRLVKGAYNEPASIAIKKKREVDRNYLALAQRCLRAASRGEGGLPAFGTHDSGLIARIQSEAETIGVPKEAYEFEMLYGIGREHQNRIASNGYRMRVLISYGTDWFPWYVRRLAERPANVWFVIRSLFSR
jgi:proline dehydrogenase